MTIMASAGDDESDAQLQAPKLTPIIVHYCSVCSLPTEYCDFTASAAQCKAASAASSGNGATQVSELESKTQELNIADKKSAAAAPRRGVMGTVVIRKDQRTKKKSLTSVSGLDDFGCKLKDVAKLLGKRFACGCAVVEGLVPGSEEIGIQGDFQFELAEWVRSVRIVASAFSS